MKSEYDTFEKEEMLEPVGEMRTLGQDDEEDNITSSIDSEKDDSMAESNDEHEEQEEKQEDGHSSFTTKRIQSENGLRKSNRLAQRQRRDDGEIDTGNFLAELGDGE